MPPKSKKKGEDEGPTGPILLGRPKNNVKMGIVGLPNIGKSTFFNILCGMNVAAENYPFCTIDPTVARVPVPDDRFDHLVKTYKPKSEVPAVLSVTDIAGLIKGASEGAGLGNAFLSHIQAVDGIFHLCRAFPGEAVTHVDGSVDPTRDLDCIHEELRKKDLAFVNAYIEKNQKNVEKKVGGKEALAEFRVMKKVQECLEAGKDVRYGGFPVTDYETLNKHQFLTAKPVVYLVNLSKKAYIKKSNKWLPVLAEWLQKRGGHEKMIPISCAFEQELLDNGGWASEEGRKWQKEQGARSCIPKIIKLGYSTLSLIRYFTAGADEVKAWTIRDGLLAPQAAGVIHGDFEKGFICADVMGYSDFIDNASDEAKVKAAGKMRMEGRKYRVVDGDIIHFKFNLGKGK